MVHVSYLSRVYSDVYNETDSSEYMFLPHSSKIMAAGCLYDAIFALGSKYLELRGNVFQLLGRFIEIDEVRICKSIN